MSGLRVLVTGATTALGRALCQELYQDVQRVDHVFAVASDETLPYYFRDFHHDRFTYWSANLLKERHLKGLFLAERFRKRAITQVVHCGFLRMVKAQGLPPSEAVQATRRLLRFCSEAKVEHLVFLSGCLVYRLRPWTSAVIDEEGELDFDPDSDPWVKARVDADTICQTYMDKELPKITVLRPGPILGRNVSSHLGDLLESYLVLRQAGYDPMVRPIHSSDVRRAIHRALDARAHGVFNVAGPDVAPLSEFCRLNGRPSLPLPPPALRWVNRVQRVLRMTSCDLSTTPRWLKYPCVLDTTRIERSIGFEAAHHIKFGE